MATAKWATTMVEDRKNSIIEMTAHQHFVHEQVIQVDVASMVDVNVDTVRIVVPLANGRTRSLTIPASLLTHMHDDDSRYAG